MSCLSAIAFWLKIKIIPFFLLCKSRVCTRALSLDREVKQCAKLYIHILSVTQAYLALVFWLTVK